MGLTILVHHVALRWGDDSTVDPNVREDGGLTILVRLVALR